MCEELQENNIYEVIAEENYLLNETNEAKIKT